MNRATKLLPWLAALVLAGACAPAAPEAEAEPAPAPEANAGAGSELYGETPETILQMSFADWEKKISENKGDIEPADHERALDFWLQAAAAHHAEKAETLGDPKGGSILLAVSLLGDAADALRDARLAAAPAETSVNVDALIAKIQVQALVHELLKKVHSLPEGMLSGNFFAEIEDSWSSEIGQSAEDFKTQEKIGPALEASIAAVRAARSGEYEGLSEAEVHAIRQLIAHWMSPGSSDPPVKFEDLGPLID